jgi:hypothetical protein
MIEVLERKFSLAQPYLYPAAEVVCRRVVRIEGYRLIDVRGSIFAFQGDAAHEASTPSLCMNYPHYCTPTLRQTGG